MRRKLRHIFLVLLLLWTTLPLQPALAHDLPVEWLQTDRQAEEAEEDLVRIVIQVTKPEHLDAIKQRIAQFQNGTVRKEYDTVFNGISATVPRHYVPLLQVMPGVESITESQVYYPLMSTSKLLTQSLQATTTYKNKGEGMLISIIDSGIDVKHKDFQTLANPELAKIKEPFVVPDGSAHDATFTMKVPYGYNFADDSYALYPADDHGAHVAGIVAANATDQEVEDFTGIDGIASEAQLLSMSVFTNDVDKNAGAYDDDIIAAIEASVEHGADIINMSLGGPNGFTAEDDPLHRAINAAQANGVLVVTAAGNDAANFSKSYRDPQVTNVFDRDDIGLVDSPSSARGSFSIASFENSHLLSYQFSYVVNGETTTHSYKIEQGFAPDATLPLVVRGKGLPSDYTANEDLSGKAVLVARGDNTFAEKIALAHQHRAAALLIYNDRAGSLSGLVSEDASKDLFTIGLTQELGTTLQQLATSQDNFSLTFSSKMVQLENSNKDGLSTFTSWGTTNALDFKPEITGVGGQVYSTLTDNKYGTYSGTSMATPHVSGASAIIISELRKELSDISNMALFAKKSMMNTTLVLKNLKNPNKLPYSPRRQGSGLLQTVDAIRNRVLATYETADGDAAGALRAFVGKKTFAVTLKNYGKQIVTFKVNPGTVQSTATTDQLLQEVESPAFLSASQSRVTLSPGEEKKISFTLDASNVTNDFVEGFITFESSKPDNQPSLTFAYMGYAGDWNQESAFDVPDTVENAGRTLYSDTRLISYVRNTTGANTLVPLGVPVAEGKVGTEKPSTHAISFSPNADGFHDVIVPQLGLFRNLDTLQFNVLNQDKQFVTRIGGRSRARRLSYIKYQDNISKKRQLLVPLFSAGTWDGYVYDSFFGTRTVAPEGQYYIQVLGQVTPDLPAQELLLPVKIDLTAPTIQVDATKAENTADGRTLTYTVTDATGVSITYAQVDGQRYPATLKDDGSYQVTIPHSINPNERVILYAYDYALNEARFELGQFQSTTLQLRDWTGFIDQVLPESGRTVLGRTRNAATRSFAFELTQTSTGDVITSTPRPVTNGRIVADFQLSPSQQGRYTAVALEYDDQQKIIQRTQLGTLIYDSTAPQVALHHATELATPDVQKYPPQTPDTGYVEYALTLNDDGSATYSGVVSDNVFAPKELLLQIGPNAESVPINEDGSFSYTLTHPSKQTHDVLTVSQPAVNSTTKAPQVGTKGQARDYLVTQYLPAPNNNTTPKRPPFALTMPYEYILGLDSIAKNPTDSKAVKERNGQYYFTLVGETNQLDSVVRVGGENAIVEMIYDDRGNPIGSRFSHEIAITEGINNVNVRVSTVEGVVQVDTKVRIHFDYHNPTLILTQPTSDAIHREQLTTVEPGTKQNDDGSVSSVTYVHTTEDFVTFAGSVSDNGRGYTLVLNGETLLRVKQDVPGTSEHGDNTQTFSRTYKVQDGDIVTLSLYDQNGNGEELTYIIRKVAAPEWQKVVLHNQIDKRIGDTVTASDFVQHNPEQYTVELLKPVDTSTPGIKHTQLRIVYDADTIDVISVSVNVKNELGTKATQDTQQATTQSTETTTSGVNTVTRWASTHPVHVSGPDTILTENTTLDVVTVADDHTLVPEQLHQYVRTTFDIRLLRDNQELSELEEPVSVQVPIDGRQLAGIYHLHNGTLHEVAYSLSEDGRSATFTTQSFSPFILAYAPVETPTVPPIQGPTVSQQPTIVKNPIARQANTAQNSDRTLANSDTDGAATTAKNTSTASARTTTRQSRNLPNTGTIEQPWYVVGISLLAFGMALAFHYKYKKR